LPLNEKTKGSFGREQFNQMKDGSVLVNTARGAVVDEEAFLEALDSGKVSSHSSESAEGSPD
jgi:lactate dehydrogenase-like 2-hydroxyacid dehydrogenase